jgi:hypothetical protein
MGEAFAGESAFENCRAEALALVFKQAPAGGDADPIDARLSQAREAAASFAKAVGDGIQAAQERERLPTTGEIAAPLRAAYRRTRMMAQRIRQSKAVGRGLIRVRRLSIIMRRRMVRWSWDLRRAPAAESRQGHEQEPVTESHRIRIP